ncbi:MAG: hypothetical protein HQ572_06430 [Candidatus Omnitrophica bacterium]|nr:hypothetical protein [Candidatus Omnitrophota bacterium]
MIEFNLLPADLKGPEKKKSSIQMKVPNIAPTPIIIGVIAVILLSQVTIGVLAVVQRKRLTRISTEINNISADEEIATALQNEFNSLSSKFSIIDSLASGSLIWSKKLYDLSESLTDGVWFNSLSLSTESPRAGANITQGAAYPVSTEEVLGRQVLVLEGSAVSPAPGEEAAVVGKLIESLRNDKEFFKDFDDIKLSSIQRKKRGQIESMDFTIVCYFKIGRSYFEKLEAGNI